MKTIELNGNEYQLPEEWSEVTVRQFEEIMGKANSIDEYKSQMLYSLEIFSILMKAPIEELKLITRNSFVLLTEQLDWVSTDPVPSRKRKWVIDGITYVPFENLDQLDMGASISLETLIANSPQHNILSAILPVLVRPEKIIYRENGQPVSKPGDFDSENYNELRELFRDKLSVTDVIKMQSFFMSGGKK